MHDKYLHPCSFENHSEDLVNCCVQNRKLHKGMLVFIVVPFGLATTKCQLVLYDCHTKLLANSTTELVWLAPVSSFEQLCELPSYTYTVTLKWWARETQYVCGIILLPSNN